MLTLSSFRLSNFSFVRVVRTADLRVGWINKRKEKGKLVGEERARAIARVSKDFKLIVD